MSARLSFLLTTALLLFFLEGQRAFFSSLFGLASDAVFAEPSPGVLAWVLMPVVVMLLPLVPISRRLGRKEAIAAAGAVLIVARLVMAPASLLPRLIGSALVVGAGASFLAVSIATFDSRSLAAGAAAAIALDQLLRLAGSSYDVTLRPEWWPAQIGVGLAVLGLLAAWLRLPDPAPNEADLERRSGGLRLRGAVALGALFFLETNALALPSVAARWSGASYPAAALLLLAAAVVAIALLLTARGPIGRHRPAALVLAATAGAAVLLPWGFRGPAVAVLFAAGHAAALLLFPRALAPAGGRRGGWTMSVGLLVLFGFNALYALTFYHAFTFPGLRGDGRWVLATAAAVLAAVLLVIPRPVRSPPLAPVTPLVPLAAAAALALGAGLAVLGRSVPETQALGTPRVASYNVHLGFAGSWRYDPEAIARAIEESGADVVALQEVPAGLLTAYHTDLALWLARRLGMRVRFAPTENALLGDAVLTRLPVESFGRTRLVEPPPRGWSRRQLVALRVRAAGGALPVYALHLGVSPPERQAQLAEALAALPAGPAVLLGDLNEQGGGRVARRLRAAGFRDAFELAGAQPAPTWPADRPVQRIDWIWLRGLAASDARVLPDAASDHRLVAVTVRPAEAASP